MQIGYSVAQNNVKKILHTPFLWCANAYLGVCKLAVIGGYLLLKVPHSGEL